MPMSGTLLISDCSGGSYGADAVGRDEVLGVGNKGGETGRGDGFAGGFLGGKVEVETEQESQRVLLLFHAVGGADGGVEGGLGVAAAVGAGGFEGAIEVGQGTGGFGDGAGAREHNQHSGRRHLARVSKVAAVERAHLACEQGDDGNSLPGQGHKNDRNLVLTLRGPGRIELFGIIWHYLALF